METDELLFKRRSSIHSEHFHSKKQQASLKQIPAVHILNINVAFIRAAIAVFTISVICFVSSYNAEFAFDDSEALINNKDVKTESPVLDLFLHDFWGSALATNTSHKSYRPFTVLTFRFNYWLSGGLYPTGFHCVNIILHGVVSILFLVFFSVLLSDGKAFNSVGSFVFRHSNSSVMCAVLFAVHPIHTENVAAVVGRADLLCALCFLTAFILYAAHIAVDSNGVCKFFLWLLSMIFVVCSVLFKEQGITVLGICCAYDVFIINKIHPQCLLTSRSSSQPIPVKDLRTSNVWILIRRQLLLALVGLAILVVRWRIMGAEPPTFQVIDNPHSFVNGTFLRILNYNYIYALNTWLLLNPWWLCFDWSMGCVPVIQSLADARLLSNIFMWLILGALVLHSLRSKQSSEQRRLLLSLSLLIIPFLPASNLFFRIGFVIAERNLYLPSAGFVMLVVLGIRRLARLNGRIVFVFLMFLIVTHTARCMHRSQDWLNEKRLFVSGLMVCPLNAKVQYNVAKVSADSGDIDRAIEKYALAISLNPEYDQAMNNLGNLYKERGDLISAERLLQQAVVVRPEFSAAWMNLGIVQAAQSQFDLAEKSYLTALKHRRRYADCFYNLGNLYLDQAKHAEALLAWRNAVNLKPTHTSAWTNSIILLDNLGRVGDLTQLAAEALLSNPYESTIHFSLASALGKANDYAASEKHFLLAIKYSPTVANYHSNLGILYHRWGKLNEAEHSYNTALRLDPNNRQTIDNLNMLERTMKNSNRDSS